MKRYPLALYVRGWDDLDAVRVVADEAAEEAARAEGFKPLADFPHPDAPTIPAHDPPPLDADNDGVVTRAEVMEALDAAGIEYDRRWGIARLRAALEA